jgi:hypothetical protein
MVLEYLARKINRNKWSVVTHDSIADIQADAITVCLRTQGNELSVWQCDTARLDVSEVVLALTLADSKSRIDKMHIILLDKNHIESDGIDLKFTSGNTLIEDLKSRHRDLFNLTMTKLCILAKRIATQIENYDGQERADISCLHSFTRMEVTNIIRTAINAGRVNKDQLPESVQKDIEK